VNREHLWQSCAVQPLLCAGLLEAKAPGAPQAADSRSGCTDLQGPPKLMQMCFGPAQVHKAWG